MQKTSENRDTANESAGDIYNLISAIKGTIDAVEGNVRSMEESLGKDQSKYLKLDQCKLPAVFSEMVAVRSCRAD
jgi:hypothetical protein